MTEIIAQHMTEGIEISNGQKQILNQQTNQYITYDSANESIGIKPKILLLDSEEKEINSITRCVLCL